MITLFIALNAFGAGWFTRAAIDTAIDRIHDWREPARWAVVGLFNIAAILCCQYAGVFEVLFGR